MGPTLDKFVADINSLRRMSASEEFYVLKHGLRQILERKTVVHILKESAIPDWRVAKLATSVCDNGVLVFAILSWIQKPEAVVDFVDKHELDDRLPFRVNDLPNISPDIPQFFDVQWAFLPVFLRKGDFRKFRHKEIIPFKSELGEPDLDGSSGAISKVTIEPSLHDFVEEQAKEGSVFVRKHIRPRAKDANRFSMELSCLEAFRLLEHANIVQLLYSYTQNSQFNFIFPCLDMDLSKFLARDKRFGEFTQDGAFYKALQGLASAVHAVHNFKIQGEVDMDFIIYHHDLRPANILVTPHTFMLADFGLSKIRPSDQGSKTEWKDTFGDYIAPECMNENFRNQKVGRSIDIWALGCMFVEIATYMVEGADGVRKARNERASLVSEDWGVTNGYFWLGNSIRSEVLHNIERLQMSRGLSIFGLLEAAKALLDVDTETRPRSEGAQSMMCALTTQCLYFEAVAGMEEYETKLRMDGHGFPSALDMWMERRKLNMWGLPLSMDTNQLMSKTLGGPLDVESMEKSQRLLRELGVILKTALPESHGRTEELEPESPFTGYSLTISHEIRKKIEGLYNLLPSRTLRQVSTMCEKNIINTIDTHDLHSMGNVLDLESEQHQEMASMALLRGLKDSLVALSSTDEEAKRLRLEEHQITGLTRLADGHHEIADLNDHRAESKDQFTPRRVMVESVPYSEAWLKRTPKERAERIAALTKLLARKKPKDLRVLDCVGYVVSNEEGYSLVFQFPSHGASSVPETLLSHLRKANLKQQKGVPRRVPEKPALEQRYRLALNLAQSVFELHSIKWLHKALNSNNILFFSSPVTFGRPDISKPYLVDFRFSRPDGTGPFTDGLDKDRGFVEYVHPDYLEKRKDKGDDSWVEHDTSIKHEGRFRQIYDYYSLGMILLEIGYWSPIEHILGGHTTATPKEVSQILLTKYIPRLGTVMGRLYMEAVTACVDGSIQEQKDTPLGINLKDFDLSVIEPLSRIFVG